MMIRIKRLIFFILSLIATSDVGNVCGNCNEFNTTELAISTGKYVRNNLNRNTIVVRDNQPLTNQFNKRNSIYVITRSFDIGKDSAINISFSEKNISQCVSPLYEGELRKLQLFQKVGIGKRLSVIGINGVATSMLITQEIIDAQQRVVDDTPQYYYYVVVKGKSGRALHIDGRKFVFLNSSKTHIDRTKGNIFCGNDGDVAYIATVYPGTYTFKETAAVKLPENSVLEFKGGSIDGGVLYGNHTNIINKTKREIFGEKIYVAGKWDIDEISDTWFKYEFQEGVAKNEVIENMLRLTHDDYFSTINISSGRNYFVAQKDIPVEHTGGIRQNIVRYAYGLYMRYYIFRMEPLVSDVVLFDLPSNVKIILNSTITMLPCSQGVYTMFDCYGKNNISIEGTGTIYGDNVRNRHDYTSLPCWKTSKCIDYYGEWGYVLHFRGCKNIVIAGITISGSFGDALGISYSIYDKETKSVLLPVGSALISDSVVIKNVTIDYTRRNGISIAARNVLIDGCKISNTGIADINGTAPKAGIDFEADMLNGKLTYGIPVYPEVGNQNCEVRNCLFQNNYFDLVIAENYNSSYDSTSVSINKCALNKLYFTEKVKNVGLESCVIKRILYPSGDKVKSAELRNIGAVECKIGQMDPALVDCIRTD